MGSFTAFFLVLPVAVSLGAESGFDVAFQEWQSAMAEPVTWERLAIIEATSSLGRIEPLADGSVPVSHSKSNPVRYIVKAKTALQEVTAFRLEMFPRRGSTHSGTQILEFQAASGNPLIFGPASADTAKTGFGPSLAIDGNPKTGWSPTLPFSEPHAAVFEIKPPRAGSGGPILMFTVIVNDGGAMARFRITATKRHPPVRELPAALRIALALEPSERTSGQRDALRAYFLSLQSAHEGSPGRR